MQRTPNRAYLLTLLTVLLVVTFSLAPGAATLAAVNESFDGFGAGSPIDGQSIPGVSSIVSNPVGSTIVQNVIPPANPPFAVLSLLNQAAGAAGTLTIDFTTLQNSYSFDYYTTNLGTPATNVFTIQLIRTGVVGPVFTDPLTNTTPTIFQDTAAHSGVVFDRMVISSTTEEWAIDNLVTTDAPPGVSVIGTPAVNEAGATTDSYVIALDSTPTGTVRIDITPDAQCTVAPTFVTFAAGVSAPQTVTVQAVDDAVTEASPHPCVITHAINTGVTTDPTYGALGALSSMNVDVTDNDVAGVTISKSAVSVSEAGATEAYTVVLDSQPNNQVDININPGTQCTLNTNPFPILLTFNNGNWNTAQTVTVGAVDDLLAEGTHTCTITHTISTVDANYSTLPPLPDVVGTITDNDNVGITVGPLNPASIDESVVTTTDYDIQLDTDPTANVHIALSPDATRCTVSPTSLDFTTGNTPQTVTVTAIDNLVDEPSPQLCVITQTVTSADPAYDNFPLANVSVPIADDDTPGISFVNGTSINVVEGGATDTYQINLDTQPSTNVTIDITTDGQCTVNPTNPVINAPGTGPVTITVTAVDDPTVEALVHPCQIDHTTHGAEYEGLTGNVVANVTDNDVLAAPVYFSNPAPNTTITINATTSVNGTAVVDIQNTGTADLTVNSYGLAGAAEITVAGTSVAPFTITTGSGATETLTLTCSSPVAGTFNSTLTVDHNALGNPATYTVTCIVTGIPVYNSTPVPTAPLTINTTTGVTGTATVDITEGGTADLTINSFSVTGGPQLTVAGTSAAPFTITEGSGTTETLTVSCDSAVAGTFTGTLTVTHNAVGSPATYPVTCNVAGVPVYNSTPAAGSPLTINTTAGVTGTATVAITEGGTANLTISSFGVTGGPELTVVGTSAAPFTITDGSGTTETLTVSCDSAVAGTFTGTLTVTHNATGSPASYAVTCNVAAPGVPVYNSTPAAGSPLTINTTTGVSGTATVVITETGTADLTINSFGVTGAAELTVSGTAAVPFTITDGSGTNLTLTVACNSGVAGTFTGTLTVAHNATGSPATYAITCVVTGAPAYNSTPAAGSPLPINTTAGVPGTATVDITEGGTADLVISSYALTGAPELTLSGSSPAPFTITDGSGANLLLTVTCNSAVANTFTGTLTVIHNAPGSPATYAVTCVVAPAAGPGYNSVPVPGTALTINTTPNINGTVPVVISENGTADLTINSYTVTGAAELTVTGPTAPFTIVDNSAVTQTVTVNCISPTVGTYTGTLTVTHNATGSPATYPVTCNVANATGPRYSSAPAPGAINFSTAVNSPANTIIRVTNTGVGTLNVSGITLTGTGTSHLALTSPTSFSLGAGAFSDIAVQCDAFVQGSFTATLTVAHNGISTPTSPVTYTITCNVGTGAPGYGSVPAPGTTVDIGTVLIGTAISNNITVFETGTGQLNVSNITLVSGFTDFSLTTVPFFSIPDGGLAQTITIRCIPSSAGLRTATLIVSTNDPTQPTVIYNLICTGSTVPVITATPPGFVPTVAPPTATVIVPATGEVKEVKGLAVRTGPYLGATLIGVARPGTTYSVLAQNKEEGSYTWYLIKVGDVTGWVSGRYLQVAGTLSVVPVGGSIFDQIDNAPDVGVRLTVNAIIDMRRRPSPRVARVATIPKDTVVVVLGRTVQEKQTFWIQVSYNGVVGWIPALPVEMVGPREVLPIR